MNKTYVFFGLAAMLSVSAFACSDDETTTTGATTTTTAGTGGGATTTTGTGGTSTTTGTGGSGGSGGEGTGGSSAAAFCAEYDTTCGFGAAERFADEAACLAYYEAASAGCVACIEEHLGNAPGMEGLHCPHACGATTCAAACGTSGCM